MKRLADVSTRPALRARRGFTLIEVMIVVAVIAILSAIALPSYLKHLQKARRTDAKNALLDLVAREERYYSVNNQYTTLPTNLGYSGAAFPVDIQTSGTAYYQLTVAAPAPAAAAMPTFSASAVPIAGGAQASDACGTYTINHLAVQGNSTAATGCW